MMTISMMEGLPEFAGKHMDPVQNVTEFIRRCRKNGMSREAIIEELEDKFQYMTLEANIIVDEFWDQTA